MMLPPPSPILAFLGRLPGWRRMVLARAGRLAGPRADDTLSRWVARDPGHLALRLRHAFGAHHAGRYSEAAARWDAVRERWPHVPIAWCGSAANRRELGHVHDAREIIAEALRRFPGDLVAITEAIRVHESLGDTAAVLALSHDMVRLDPDRPEWRRQLFDRLLAARLVEEAAVVLDVPRAEGGDPRLTVCRVLLALRRGDPAEAEAMLRHLAPVADADAAVVDELRRAAVERKLRHPGEACHLLAHLRRVAPDDPETRHHACDALVRAGRHDEAATEIAAALDRFPDDDDLRCDGARLALKTKRWDEAVAAFDDLLSRRPDDPEILGLRAGAVMERAMAALETGAGEDGDAAPAFAERQDVGLVEDEAVRRLLLGFESLGQDCEFGLVQRRFGAEPLGLFRWNSTRTAVLREALDQNLAGLGDPQHTTISLWDDYEYHLSDRRWGFGFHTFVTRHEAERDALFASMGKRLGFLRRKLLSDLAAGDKILVHKTFEADADTVRALFASLRRHGPVRLLWVRALTHLPDGGAGHRVGLGAEIEPGLVTGYVSAFGNRTNKPWAIAFEEWIGLCRAAAAMAVPDRARSMEAAG